eukprot:COSAG02_NODE_9471_length_2206_cov_1.986711_2_plen_393_part_00
MSLQPSRESTETMMSTADEATQALSAAKEYDDYALVINAMPLAAALRACEQEGIIPRDTSLLGLRAALLLHFCGPPPTATTDEDGRQARAARAQQMRRGKRSRRGDRENRSRVPIWALQEFNAMAGEPALEADDFTGLIQNMAWQEAHVACRRLGITVDGLSGDGVRQALYDNFVIGSEGDNPGSSVRLRADDYRTIVMHLTPDQAVAACHERGIVPVDWEHANVQAALRTHLLGPLTNPERTSMRRSFRSAAKSVVAVATAKGVTPFQKWRNYRSAREDAADLERAKRIFEGIDLDRSGELENKGPTLRCSTIEAHCSPTPQLTPNPSPQPQPPSPNPNLPSPPALPPKPAGVRMCVSHRAVGVCDGRGLGVGGPRSRRQQCQRVAQRVQI